jgi:hypothetical protein
MLRLARPPARPVRLILLGLVLAGCGSPPELDKQLDTLASWTATMQLAAAEHRSHAITATAAAQLDDAAHKALDEVQRSLGEAARSRADSGRAIAAVDSLRDAMRQLEAETHR